MLNEHNRVSGVRPALLIILGLLAFIPGLSASTVQCDQESLADLLDQGACTLGSFTLDNFSFSSSETGGANLVSASQIEVDPTGSTLTDLSLQLSTDGGFQVAAGQTAEYVFGFTVDPAFPDISGPSIDMGPNDPATLTGEFCGDGTLVSGPDVSPVMCEGTANSGIFPASLLITGNGSPSTQSYTFPSLVTTMDSRLVLDLTGPSDVSSFGVSVNVTGGGPSPVPEPSTSLFLAPALVGLAWLRKKLATSAS